VYGGSGVVRAACKISWLVLGFHCWQLGLLFSAMPTQAVYLQLEDPLSAQIIANEQVSGQLNLGTLSILGKHTDLHARIDGVYPLSAGGQILPYPPQGIPDAMLYVMGVNPGQAAFVVRVGGLNELDAELYASWVGDLEVFLSESSVSWQPGAFLNGLDHIQLPNDHQLVPLRGTGGRISTQPMQIESPELSLDLGVKLSRDAQAGSKSGSLDFTVVAF